MCINYLLYNYIIVEFDLVIYILISNNTNKGIKVIKRVTFGDKSKVNVERSGKGIFRDMHNVRVFTYYKYTSMTKSSNEISKCETDDPDKN